jgi:hypothetical protein
MPVAAASLIALLLASGTTEGGYQGGWVLWLQWGGSSKKTSEGALHTPADRFERISAHSNKASCDAALSNYKLPDGNVYLICLPETFHPRGVKQK